MLPIKERLIQYDSLSSAEVHSNWINSFDFRGKKVLDLGCGSGRDAEHFFRRGAKVIAIDSDPICIAHCKENHVGPEFMLDKLPALPALLYKDDELYDLIVCSAVLMFCSKAGQKQCIETMSKLLSTKGKIVFTIKVDPLDNSISTITPELLEDIRDMGYDITCIKGDSDKMYRESVTWDVYILE